MTMKIKQAKPKTRVKKSQGWHRLSLEELVYWAYAWKVSQNHPKQIFQQKETVTALCFGCGQKTINRRNHALVKAKVAQRLHEGERGKNSWFVENTLCMTVAPPDCVLRLANVAAEIRAKSPKSNVTTDGNRMNSGDEPQSQVNLIATTHIPLNSKSVSIEGIHIGTVCNSSGVGSNATTDGNRMNSGDEPQSQVTTESPELNAVRRQLRDAQNKLLRLQRDYGNHEAITVAQSDRVAELKAKLGAS